MLVITDTDPGNKPYKIKPNLDLYCDDFWLCYPETEADYLELLLVHNGNNLTGDFYFCEDELPNNLTIKGHLTIPTNAKIKIPLGLKITGILDIAGTEIDELPSDLIVNSLYMFNTKIPDNYTIPIGVKSKLK